MLSKRRTDQLKKFLRSLQIPVKDLRLYDRGLTHKSFANEQNLDYNNETLEFLGDSVLQLVVNEYLFLTYPGFKESKLSRIKSFVVSKKNLYKLAKDLRLGSALLVGKGEMNTGGLIKESNLANALEAVIGAFYLDRGLIKVQKTLLPLLIPQISLMAENKVDFDNKSQLQEYAQRVFRTRPVYRVIETRGPEHNMVFRISVFINDRNFGTGEGTRKIMAEEQAARNALTQIHQQERAVDAGSPES